MEVDMTILKKVEMKNTTEYKSDPVYKDEQFVVNVMSDDDGELPVLIDTPDRRVHECVVRNILLRNVGEVDKAIAVLNTLRKVMNDRAGEKTAE